MENISNNNFENNRIDIRKILDEGKELLLFFKKYILLLIFGTLISGSIGILYSYFQKPVYVATLTYALEDDKNSGGLNGALSLASSFGYDLGAGAGSAFGATNLVELMHSRNLIEKTLLSTVKVGKEILTLADYYILINELNKSWKSKPELFNIKFSSNRNNFSRIQDSLLWDISKKIDQSSLLIFQKDKKVSIVTIECRTQNELFSKFFCENLVKEVSSFYIETKSKKAKLNVSILEKQADSIRSELNAAITGVAVSADNTFNLNPALNVKRAPTAKRQVDVQANTAILTQLVANLEMARVALRKETPLIQVIDSPILPLKVEKLGKKKGLLYGSLFGFATIFSFIIFKRVSKDFFEPLKK